MNINQIKFFCGHETHIARYRGYGECIRLISNTNDDNSPIWNDLSVLITSCCVGDSHEPSQEKGLQAVLAFVDRAPPKITGAIANQLMHQIITKGLIASPSSTTTKTLSIKLTLLLIEIGESKQVQNQLLENTNSQNPTIISACINVLTQCLHEFGPQIIDTEILLEKLSLFLEFYQTDLVRQEAKMMAVELNRWSGPKLRKKLKLLEAGQRAELEHLLESLENGGKARPLRRQRYQQQNPFKKIDDDDEEEEEEEKEEEDKEEVLELSVRKEDVLELDVVEPPDASLKEKAASFVDQYSNDTPAPPAAHSSSVKKIDEKVVEQEKTKKVYQQNHEIVQVIHEEVQPEPVNILMKLPVDFNTKLQVGVFRKASLKYLEYLTAVPKLESGVYLFLIGSLTNVLVKNFDCESTILAATCLKNLANGLQGRFEFHACNCLSTVLKTFHVTKPHVVAVLRETVDAIYQSMNIYMILETVVLELTNWNASVRAETAGFLSRCLRKTKLENFDNNLLRIYSSSLIQLLDDCKVYVKNSSAEALGVLMKLVGEEIMMEFLCKLDESKVKIIKKFADDIEI